MNSTIRVAKTKLIICATTAQLICVFDFAYANCWFSGEGSISTMSCCQPECKVALTGEKSVLYKLMIRRPSSSTISKIFFSKNRLANLVEILCGASLDSGIVILFAVSWSHDQDGRHTHIW